MVPLNQKSLISKLDGVCRRALEGAAGLCLSRTNYNVEIEHWLQKILESDNTDLDAILKHFNVDRNRLLTDLNRSLDKLKTGNADLPRLSPRIVQVAREAWLLASVEFGGGVIRSGHLLAAMVADDALAREARDISAEFERVDFKVLEREWADVVADTSEAADVAPSGGEAPAEGGRVAPGKPTSTPSLDQFTIDLTARAKAGNIDPVIGRDPEIRQLIDILTRRRQNNPILTGEAGVGKTAVVEGFALRVANKDVPKSLENVAVRTLDVGLLQAGAGVRGEFENRLKGVINEVKASPRPIILFIDEAHTLIGAGGQQGQGDAANLLKPALARGELRTIAATTWSEYKQYIENDAALTRRFQVVKVEEPGEAVAIEMLRGLVDTLEKHHGVRILDEAVIDAVRLSNRYISGRQLPDKAISLLDTTCARVALGQSSTPSAIEDCRRRIDQLTVEIEALERETVAGTDHAERLAQGVEAKKAAEERLAALEQRWEREKEVVEKVRTLRARLERTRLAAGEESAAEAATGETPSETPASEAGDSTEAVPVGDPETLRTELAEAQRQLLELQGEEPLIRPHVDGQAVANIVSAWTGIPAGRMVADAIRNVLDLKDRMEERVVGQSHALEAIAQALRTSHAKLKDPRTPVGVFMLAGPSGVGKTETAIVLSELMYGGEQNMTVINMSEYKEEHKVSLLMGPPPGYVGYGKGGVLTEAVRRRPYSVVLLDEFEKSHEGVQEVFYQVFDKGSLQDSEGRQVDFKNTILILTTNAGTDFIAKTCADPELAPDPETLAGELHGELLKVFKPAFLGRVTLVPYLPLGDEILAKIIELKLGRIGQRVRENYNASFDYDREVVQSIRERCREVESGARNVDHILTRTLLPEMSSEFLSRMADGEDVGGVTVRVGEDGNFRYDVA